MRRNNRCFLRSVAPAEVNTMEIYRGAVPIIGTQIVVLALLWTFPQIATTLPKSTASPSARVERANAFAKVLVPYPESVLSVRSTPAVLGRNSK